MKERLTPAQKRVFDFIVAFKAAHDGNSPSVREILHGVGHTASTSTIHHHLAMLRQKGYLRADVTTGQYRNIEVVGGSWSYAPPNRLTSTGD